MVVGLAVLAVTVSAWFVLPGLVAAVAIGLGAAPGLAEHLGLSQRVAEVAAFAGLAVAVA